VKQTITCTYTSALTLVPPPAGSHPNLGQPVINHITENAMEGAASTTYTLEECKKHTSDKDCWIVVHGKVYNVTDFLEEHPGGYDIILTSAGVRSAAPVAQQLGAACVVCCDR
jgi:cytochrome b involved in lipid metabolism